MAISYFSDTCENKYILFVNYVGSYINLTEYQHYLYEIQYDMVNVTAQTVQTKVLKVIRHMTAMGMAVLIYSFYSRFIRT